MITSYDNLPYRDYLRIIDIVEDKDRSEFDKQVALVAILDGKTEAQVLDLPIADFKACAKQLAFLEAPAPDPVPVRPPNHIRLGGFDLRIVMPEKMNTAQFVDYQQLLPQGRSAMPSLLSVFLVPVGKVYGHTGDDDPKAYDIEAVRAAVATITVTRLEGVAAFFLMRWRQRLSRSLRSLDRRLERMIPLVKDPAKQLELRLRLRRLRQLGDGLTRSLT